MIPDNHKPQVPSEKLLAAAFQTISGNKVSQQATFAAVEKKITQNSYETGVIVDQYGFVLAAYKGTRGSVNFAGESYKVRGNIVTHNHPSGSAVFSVADIKVTGSLGGVGIRAATKTNGTASLVKVSQRADFEGLAGEYRRFLSHGRSVKEAQDWLSQNAGKYGLKFKVEK